MGALHSKRAQKKRQRKKGGNFLRENRETRSSPGCGEDGIHERMKIDRAYE